MRVVFWSELFRPDIGGIEVFAEQLMAELRPRGFDFAVLCSRRNLENPENDLYDGMKVCRLPFHKPLLNRDLPGVRRLAEQILSFLQEWKPDLIHLNTIGPSLFYFERCLKRLPIPTLLTMHSDKLGTLDAETLFARALGLCQHVNAVSQDTLNSVLETCPDAARKCSVILNGLKRSEEPVLPLSCDPPVFLCIGRLVSVKGFDTALDAFARFRERHPEARMMIAGDGPERAALQAQAARLELEGAVEFLGWVQPGDVPALMNTATAVVMPSCYREPFGLVAVQAGQAKRPLLGTIAGGIPEIVIDGETGFLVAQRDAAALAEVMERLVSDPARAAAMGARAREHVLETFDVHRMARQYEALYRQIGACAKEPAK